jgi:hypothetical protein
MVIDQINVQRVPVGETEYQTPIRPHRHGPEAFQVALQRVKAKAGHSHVRRHARAVESSKDPLELVDILSAQLAPVIILEEPSQALVPKASYHWLVV